MEPTEIERVLLLSIKKPDDIALLRSKYGISVLNFPIYHQEAEFIYNFIREYDRVPLKDEVLLEFPSFPHTEGSENLDFIASEFNKEVIRRETIRTAHAYLKPDGIMENDSRGGINTFINGLTNIRDKYVFVDSSHRTAIDSEGALMRLQRYEELIKGEKTIDTYELGIEPLENRIRCLPGNLIGLFADTGVGKSWVAARIASEFFIRKEKVVVISPELSVEEMDYRTDVILANRMGYELSYYKLLYGIQDIAMRDEYKKFLAELGATGNWVNYDSIEGDFTVESVESIIVNEKPRFVVVDGIYLMDDRAPSSWEEVKVRSNGLKKLATKYKVVILATNQARRDAATEGKAVRKEEVANGFDFARAVDILLSVAKISDTDRIVRELRVLKNRGGADIDEVFTVSFEPDKGDVGKQPSPAYAPPDDIINY